MQEIVDDIMARSGTGGAEIKIDCLVNLVCVFFPAAHLSASRRLTFVDRKSFSGHDNAARSKLLHRDFGRVTRVGEASSLQLLHGSNFISAQFPIRKRVPVDIAVFVKHEAAFPEHLVLTPVGHLVVNSISLEQHDRLPQERVLERDRAEIGNNHVRDRHDLVRAVGDQEAVAGEEKFFQKSPEIVPGIPDFRRVAEGMGLHDHERIGLRQGREDFKASPGMQRDTGQKRREQLMGPGYKKQLILRRCLSSRRETSPAQRR